MEAIQRDGTEPLGAGLSVQEERDFGACVGDGLGHPLAHLFPLAELHLNMNALHVDLDIGAFWTAGILDASPGSDTQAVLHSLGRFPFSALSALSFTPAHHALLDGREFATLSAM
jgi:hypothetical protein